MDGESLGLSSVDAALKLAMEAGVDLVEISPNAEPPVCRIMDYGKFLYEKSKSQKEQKKKQKQVAAGETDSYDGDHETDEGDYQVKLRNLKRFLEDGDKAKVTLKFKGREMAHQELGLEVLKRIEEDLADVAVVESQSKVEGKQAIMVLAPKKK